MATLQNSYDPPDSISTEYARKVTLRNAKRVAQSVKSLRQRLRSSKQQKK